MALVKCGECGSKISDKATACPKCGAPPSVAKQKSRSYGLWGVFVLLLLSGFVSSAVSNCSAEKQQQAKAQAEAQERQARRQVFAEAQKKRIDAFNSNPASTLMQAQRLADEQKWTEVRQLLAPFLPAKNSDVQRFYDDASEKQLLATGAKIPATDLKRNYEYYNQLAALRPTNKTYASKRDTYKAKFDQQQAKELAERLLFGDQPTKSAWDGTYPEVKTYLKRVANDPDSIDMVGCTDVYKNKDGWLVGCQYRGKNAFGGMILTANWFRLRRGQVVEEYHHDKFEWPGG